MAPLSGRVRAVPGPMLERWVDAYFELIWRASLGLLDLGVKSEIRWHTDIDGALSV